jgi:hypothetical protein
MKTTKYLDNEIELLNAIKRNNELSDYGKEKLSEFNAIKQALTIPVVVVPKGTLCECKKHSLKKNYGFEICTKCGNEFDD